MAASDRHAARGLTVQPFLRNAATTPPATVESAAVGQPPLRPPGHATPPTRVAPTESGRRCPLFTVTMNDAAPLTNELNPCVKSRPVIRYR